MTERILIPIKTHKQTLEQLRDKIEWEGGLHEYAINYGGIFPKDLRPAVRELKRAFDHLEMQLLFQYKKYGVEPY